MRLLKEPLFHFLLLGLAIFGWYAWLNPPDPEADTDGQIVIDAQDVERLEAQFQGTWRRPPTEDELAALVESMVREEVLVREAKALGLDQGDGVIRNRLSQKMSFLTTSVAQSMVPGDDDLAAHLERHPDRFVRSATLEFEQMQLPEGTDPTATLAALKGGADPGTLSGRSLLPPAMQAAGERTVDATFGRGFFAQLVQQPVGEWAGPVTSGYGPHLVRVLEARPAEVPTLDQVRDSVLLDWRRETSETLTEAQIEGLKAQYEIVLPESVAQPGEANR
ncbi:parvulin-like peptidyl-prolyl cis-trans isomerase protein [Aliiruegeria haliotis]|uniref:Parvulin-like peptidyl-prolyl cis-trans isomerase protein n=1 Tax=Aliiruegeria haliotis TaxID=1280846 RepID=A0A2T0RN14_9RHOB|nr:peptidylprolyl isomerase [Aliiruegeria haliotis]PRY22585.1 parvulin-like peptidyl-prolyl cis-trans isomerase protein [Aliiruegeria haliotis]